MIRPLAFIALASPDPARLTVEEHDTGIILLLPMGLS